MLRANDVCGADKKLIKSIIEKSVMQMPAISLYGTVIRTAKNVPPL